MGQEQSLPGAPTAGPPWDDGAESVPGPAAAGADGQGPETAL